MTKQIDNKTVQPRWKLVAFVIVYTAAMKVLPYVLTWFGFDIADAFNAYPWGFSPIFALGIFGAAIYKNKSLAIIAPLLVWLAGDIGIWAVTGRLDWAFYPKLPVIYVAFAICAVLGFLLREKRTWGRVAGAGVASCVTFFLITNLASWVGSPKYPQTIEGLMLCYEAGLPFLKNHLASTAIFGALMFSPACIRESQPAESQPELIPAPNLS